MEVVDKRDYFNVLAPADAEIDCDTRRSANVIRLEEVMRVLKGVPNQIVLIDACREIAFRRCAAKKSGGETKGEGFKGFVPVAAEGERIMMAFATGQKATAFDSWDGKDGENSPFAKVLLEQLTENPNANLHPLMYRTIVGVGQLTKFLQVPTVTVEGGVPEVCLAGVACTEGVVDVAAMRQDVKKLANMAETQTEKGAATDGLLLSLEALPDEKAGVKRPHESTAEEALSAARTVMRERVVLAGHANDVWSSAWSPDGKYIVTASEDKTARIWLPHGSSAPVILQGHSAAFTHVAWSPDSRRIATASRDKIARVWLADGTGAPIELLGHRMAVVSVAWSPSGQHIVTSSDDHTARVWLADGTGAPIELAGHTKGIVSAAWSHDGLRIVTASRDNTARVWLADGSSTPVVLAGHVKEVTSAAWNRDGRIVTVSRDGTARVWMADGSGKSVVLAVQDMEITSAAWSPDDRYIVTTSRPDPPVWRNNTTRDELLRDNTVRVWTADGSSTPVKLVGHIEEVTSAAWSPDSLRIVTAADNIAWVWMADGSGTPIVLAGHIWSIKSVTWSPEGQYIVTTSRFDTKPRRKNATRVKPTPDKETPDNTARVWDARSFSVPVEPEGQSPPSGSPNENRDGNQIVTASSDRPIRNSPVFPTTQDLVDAAKAAVPRCLTKKQREDFGLPPEPPKWCAEMGKWPYATAAGKTP